jgi:hypothetical protein
MEWIYSINFTKNSDGVLLGVSTIKKLLDSDQSELAVQSVGLEEYVLNTSPEAISEMYALLRAEVISSLDVLVPIDVPLDDPTMSYRSPMLSLSLGRAITDIMSIGVQLYDKGRMS